MKRVPFELHTDYYDERLLPIDEQICALFKKRKDISEKNPGFPPTGPYVEPKGFRKYEPILKSVEKGECMYTLSFVRQYENASVINLIIDWESENDSPDDRFHRHTFWELVLGEQYDCRMSGGGGSDGHISYNFIVSPPLPDNLSGMDLVFKEFKTPYKDKTTGVEIVFHVD